MAHSLTSFGFVPGLCSVILGCPFSSNTHPLYPTALVSSLFMLLGTFFFLVFIPAWPSACFDYFVLSSSPTEMRALWAGGSTSPVLCLEWRGAPASPPGNAGPRAEGPRLCQVPPLLPSAFSHSPLRPPLLPLRSPPLPPIIIPNRLGQATELGLVSCFSLSGLAASVYVANRCLVLPRCWLPGHRREASSPA